MLSQRDSAKADEQPEETIGRRGRRATGAVGRSTDTGSGFSASAGPTKAIDPLDQILANPQAARSAPEKDPLEDLLAKKPRRLGQKGSAPPSAAASVNSSPR